MCYKNKITNCTNYTWIYDFQSCERAWSKKQLKLERSFKIIVCKIVPFILVRNILKLNNQNISHRQEEEEEVKREAELWLCLLFLLPLTDKWQAVHCGIWFNQTGKQHLDIEKWLFKRNRSWLFTIVNIFSFKWMNQPPCDDIISRCYRHSSKFQLLHMNLSTVKHKSVKIV